MMAQQFLNFDYGDNLKLIIIVIYTISVMYLYIERSNVECATFAIVCVGQMNIAVIHW